MRKRRTSPEVAAAERRQKSVERDGDTRYSTRVTRSPEDAPLARHGFIDRLSYNYGHQEGGKPRRGDLKSIRVRKVSTDFVPDARDSSFDRKLRAAHYNSRPLPDGRDLFQQDPEARKWWIYFNVRREGIPRDAAIELAALLRRLGPDANRVATAIREHSDLAPAPRATVQRVSCLSDGQFATALLILKQRGLLQEHTKTWPPEYSLKPPTDRG